MAREKFDGMIEAVRYRPNGDIDQVRFYERRGPTFSDHKIIDRAGLIAFLQEGKKLVTGQRKELMASTFDVAGKVYLVKQPNGSLLITTQKKGSSEHLQDVPLF